MHFIRNIEDDKLEVHFSKPEYMAMPEDRKKIIKRSCLFSGQRSCWRSRGKIESWSAHDLIKSLKEWGFEDRGTIGEKLSFAEKVEREQEKAAKKTEIFDARQDKAEKQSDQTFNHAFDMLSVIPPGQPILVGHHSERGHRNLLKKHDNTMRKAFDLKEKAEYYANKLKNAEYTAEGTKFKNAGYLVNRIKECQANINTYKRRQQGKFYSYSSPKPVSEADMNYWQEKIDDETDKQDYMRYCLEQLADAKKIFTKESLADKKVVMIRGRWEEVAKLNRTTISVCNHTIFPNDSDLAKKHALKYNYGEVQDAK